MKHLRKVLSLVIVLCMICPTGISLADNTNDPIITSAIVSKYVNTGTEEAPVYTVQEVDILDAIADGQNKTNDSNILYNNPKKIDELGWTVEETKNQHWVFELDKSYKLEYIEMVYNYTNLWVDFKVQVSDDNATWSDVGTVRPYVASANGEAVKVPLKSSQGKFIKLTLVQRYATNGNDAIWGPNYSAGGCQIAIFEVLSVKKSALPTISKVTVTKYATENSAYVYKTIDVTDELTDDNNTNANNSKIVYYKKSVLSGYGMTANENAAQHILVELDKVYDELGYINVFYNAQTRWVDFNVQVSEDKENWTDLGTIRAVATVSGSSVEIPLKWAKGKYIKLTMERRLQTNGTGTTEWVPNSSWNIAFNMHEIISVSGVKDNSLDSTDFISSFNRVFTSKDTFVLENGKSYTGFAGAIFAKAVEKSGDYTRTEYGVAFSEKELELKDFQTDESVVWAKGEKISSSSQYGIRFLGENLRENKTYFTVPYAKYENSKGEGITVMGNNVISFTPGKASSGSDSLLFSESFEDGGAEWTIADVADVSVKVEATTASDGIKSLSFADKTSSSTTHAKSPFIDVVAGKTYEISADFKNTVGTTTKMWYKLYNDKNQQLVSASIGLSPSIWHHDSDFVTAPSGATKLQLWIGGTGSGISSAYVDNIAVRELSEDEAALYIPKTLDAPQVIDGIPTEENSEFHIYLCIGQSNMVGYDNIRNEDIVVVDNAYLLNADGNWEAAQPYPAYTTDQGEYMAGFNRYSTANPGIHGSTGKMGPTISFSRGITNHAPEGVKIGIISNALGGTIVDEWSEGYEGTTSRPDNNLYEKALIRTKAALEKGGVLKGILWLQGESDANTKGYMEKLVAIADGLRESLGVSKEEVPFIVSEVAHVRPACNNVLRTAPQYIDNCAVVSSEGLSVFDSLHFEYESQRVLGLRFAEAILSKVYKINVPANEMYEEIYDKKPEFKQ